MVSGGVLRLLVCLLVSVCSFALAVAARALGSSYVQLSVHVLLHGFCGSCCEAVLVR